MLHPKSHGVLRSSLAALAAFLITSFFLVILTQGQQPPTQPELRSEDVSDEELGKLGESMEQIQIIRVNLENKMAGVQDPSQAQQLQQQANTEMVQVLKDHDMEPARYNSLVQAINSDKGFLARFQAVDKERKEQDEQEQKRKQQNDD